MGFRTHAYPGFYATESGFSLPHRVDSVQEIATIYTAQQALGLPAALLVANPIPAQDQLDPALFDGVIEKAWTAVAARGVQGQAVTPFLLDFIRSETGGASVAANLALYRNNVALAAQVAVALGAKGPR